MPVTTRSEYLNYLDAAYKLQSVTSILDVDPDLIKETEVAGTFLIPKLTLVGLGDYSTSTGFPDGNASLAYEAYTYTQDRGRDFNVDAVEEMETAYTKFGNLAKEFIRLHVAPEVDAYRFAKLCTDHGLDVSGTTLSDASGVVAALNTAMDAFDNAEVPEGNRILFINSTLLRLAKNAASTASTTDALDACTVVPVPSGRFYSAITLDAGATGSAGGFVKADGAKDINFMMVDKAAVFADAKHQAMRVFTPEQNQALDAWDFQYRIKHDCWGYSAKVEAGIYTHTK